MGEKPQVEVPEGQAPSYQLEIEDIAVGDGVTVRSAGDAVSFPPGAFGLEPAELAERLHAARGIDQRTDVIASLNAR